jgi:hypothetical protein
MIKHLMRLSNTVQNRSWFIILTACLLLHTLGVWHARAESVAGILTATATVSARLIPTVIPLYNGSSITRDLPQDALVTTHTEPNNIVRIVIEY